MRIICVQMVNNPCLCVEISILHIRVFLVCIPLNENVNRKRADIWACQ
jgi:hypothetical protein